MSWQRRYLIVPSASLEAANARAKELDPDPGCGLNTFNVPLSPSGKAPATHWRTAVAFSPEMADAIDAEVPSWPGASCYDLDAMEEAEILKTAGLQLIEDE